MTNRLEEVKKRVTGAKTKKNLKKLDQSDILAGIEEPVGKPAEQRAYTLPLIAAGEALERCVSDVLNPIIQYTKTRVQKSEQEYFVNFLEEVSPILNFFHNQTYNAIISSGVSANQASGIEEVLGIPVLNSNDVGIVRYVRLNPELENGRKKVEQAIQNRGTRIVIAHYTDLAKLNPEQAFNVSYFTEYGKCPNRGRECDDIENHIKIVSQSGQGIIIPDSQLTDQHLGANPSCGGILANEGVVPGLMYTQEASLKKMVLDSMDRFKREIGTNHPEITQLLTDMQRYTNSIIQAYGELRKDFPPVLHETPTRNI